MTATELHNSPHVRSEIRRRPPVVLDLSGGRNFSVNPNGSGKTILVTVVIGRRAGRRCRGRTYYWTNMGVPSKNDGSIERADLDGRNRGSSFPDGDRCTQASTEGAQPYCDRRDPRLDRPVVLAGHAMLVQ